MPMGTGGRTVHDLYPSARADLDVLATRLQDNGDPLGHVLALWLAPDGEAGPMLREEHVMGLETMTSEEVTVRCLREHGMEWRLAGGWGWLEGQGAGMARPVLEARPA